MVTPSTSARIERATLLIAMASCIAAAPLPALIQPIQAKRDVDLVILPKTAHRVAQPFFWRKFRDYFTRNLPGEASLALLPLTPVPADASITNP